MTQPAFSLFTVKDSAAQFVTVSLTGQIRSWTSSGLEVKHNEVLVDSPDPKKQVRVCSVVMDKDTLAIGMKTGHVALVDVPTRSQYNVQIGSRPVSSLCFSSDGSRLFCSEESGKVYFVKRRGAAHLHEWNLPTVVVPKDDTRPVMKIEADVLYVAAKSGNRLKAYEVTTGRQLKKWAQCSAPPIRHIAKAPSDEHDKFGRLACSFEQRHLSFFVNEHTSSLAACLDMNLFRESGEQNSRIHVLAVTELGYIDIWEVDCNPSSNHVKVTAAIGRIHSKDESQFLEIPASLISRQLYTNMMTLSDSMKVYMDKAGKIVPELSFTPVEQTSRNPGEKKQKKIVSEGQTKATVLGPLDMIPSRTMKDTPQNTVAEPEPITLRQTPILFQGAQSLEKPLVQAIRTDDKQLLKKITDNNNPTLINNTVERLPLEIVYPFLAYLISQLQAAPAAVAKILPWIKSLLLCHTSYLLSVPHIASSLAPLQTSIEDRLNTFDELTRMQGKLQFLLNQASDNPGWDVDTSHATRYREREAWAV